MTRDGGTSFTRLLRRLRLARALKVAPWRIPRSAVDLVGLDRPPEQIFEAFRRLHGIEERR